MTHSSIIDISSNRVITWMKVVRETSGAEQYRLLENFWPSQISSKSWIINTIKSLQLPQTGNVYIFGGWYGILASLIKDNFLYDTVYSIDIDPGCRPLGKRLDDRIKFVVSDMKDIDRAELLNAGLIINTSTEHISQETFDVWMSNMPLNVPIILQGNNYFDCAEHIRCVHTIEEFDSLHPLDEVLFLDQLDCVEFTRFMKIGYKK